MDENPKALADEDVHDQISEFFEKRGNQTIISEYRDHNSFSDLIGGCLQVKSVQMGKICCMLKAKAPTLNTYGGMHGGAVAAVAERIAIACARSVVGNEKHLFLAELGISYLLASPHNAELKVDGSMMRSGRNLTVVAVNFRFSESNQLVYIARATFYNMPNSSL